MQEICSALHAISGCCDYDNADVIKWLQNDGTFFNWPQCQCCAYFE